MSKTDSFSSLTLFAALLAFAGAASAGAVYTCKDTDGKSVYQATPCSIDSLNDTQASDESRRQEAVLQAAAADYAQRIKEVEAMMENDVKMNQTLEHKGQ
ncbi:MAG: DUF4124 domain-containing protein [Pseudomonas sp.]